MKRSRKQKRRAKIIFWLAFWLVLLTYGSVQVASKSIPLLRQIAVHEARNVTSNILVDAVRAQSFELKRTDESYMTGQINEAISSILKRAYDSFQAVQIDVLETQMDGKRRLPAGVIYEVPLGSIIHIPFLVNSGPMIPVRMRLLGDVVGNMRSKVTPYGINNALLEIMVELKVRVQVVSPLIAEEIEVIQEIPLALEVFEGEVPHYFPWYQTQTSGNLNVSDENDEGT